MPLLFWKWQTLNDALSLPRRRRGARRELRRCPLEETVTELLDLYTVKLDGLYITPISLIREVSTRAAHMSLF